MNYPLKQVILFVLGCLLLSCADEPRAVSTTKQELDEPASEPIKTSTVAVPLMVLSILDSALLAPGSASSPMAFYEVNSFVPNAESPTLNRLINKSLGRLIVGDEYPLSPTNHQRHLEVGISSLLRQYQSQKVDSSDWMGQPSGYASFHHHNAKVLLNEKKLLSIGANYYYFTGGVHGNHETVLHTFLTDPAKRLTYAEIFKPGQEAAIADLVKEVIRSDREDLPLDFEKPTTNIALTKEGVLFNYPPYEIGSYSEGEIEATVTYKQLLPFLSEQAKTWVAPYLVS